MADNKRLQDLARNDPNGFEEYYKKNVDSKADGPTIAAKQSYYKNLDLSSTNTTTTPLPKQNIGNKLLVPRARRGGRGVRVRRAGRGHARPPAGRQR
jgi:hypothetical protein